MKFAYLDLLCYGYTASALLSRINAPKPMWFLIGALCALIFAYRIMGEVYK